MDPSFNFEDLENQEEVARRAKEAMAALDRETRRDAEAEEMKRIVREGGTKGMKMGIATIEGTIPTSASLAVFEEELRELGGSIYETEEVETDHPALMKVYVHARVPYDWRAWFEEMEVRYTDDYYEKEEDDEVNNPMGADYEAADEEGRETSGSSTKGGKGAMER